MFGQIESYTPLKNKSKATFSLKETEVKSIIEATNVAKKILQEYPNVNIGSLIECLQRPLVSTTQCCKKMGISYSAFLRLRKKYNIVPAYTIQNNVDSLKKSFKTFNPMIKITKARKNFYNVSQLSIIPENEIKLIQLRAARSLNYPNGDKIGWQWIPRGFHRNGKLKARTDNLEKINIKVEYLLEEDKYKIDHKSFIGKLLSRAEVDKFNIQIHKMKMFL